jgi:hypothetical protein
MNNSRRLLFALGALSALSFLCVPLRAIENVFIDAGGVHLGSAATDRVGLYGKGVAQPASSAQAALTDSTTGTAGTTLAAGTGVQTVAIPVILNKITGAADVLTAYTPGYRFKILSVSFAVSSPVTTAAKAATLTFKIGSTVTTGGAMALTSANCTPLGALVAGSSITAANVGLSTDTITLAATAVTAFAEGEGYVLVRLQNMDTADAAASLANLLGALRTANVNVGVIKGGP